MIGTRLFRAAAILAVLVPAAAKAACKPADATLAGVYQLRGVMETGSVLRLAADGRFGYMLTYGAYDEVARGCWRREAGAIVLTASEIKKNAPMGPSFKRQLRLSLNAKGELVRQMSPRHTGRYVRVRKAR